MVIFFQISVESHFHVGQSPLAIFEKKIWKLVYFKNRANKWYTVGNGARLDAKGGT